MELIFAIGGFSIFVLTYVWFLSHFVPKENYSFLNIIMALGSIIFALALGLSFGQIGLDKDSLIKGFVYGVLVIVPILVSICVVLIIPRLRHIFTDQSSKLSSSKDISYELLFRIPFGTAFSEEILFRGVLMGMLLTSYSTATALVASSIVFGLWHVAPTWKTLQNNKALSALVGDKKSLHGISILGAVLTTATAGFAFGVLRIWSDSVITPWIAHLSINGFAVAGGILAHQLKMKNDLKKL